jgi:hypothetical protein
MNSEMGFSSKLRGLTAPVKCLSDDPRGTRHRARNIAPHTSHEGSTVKRLFFWVSLPVLCSERERPFFVPSPAIRFPERAEGVKGPKR